MLTRPLQMSLVALALAAGPAVAEEICAIRAVVRCPCPASMMVACESGKEGFVDDEAKAKSITLTIQNKRTRRQRDVVLNDPPAGVRAYYGNLNDDPWITAQLAEKGITDLAKYALDVTSIRFGDDVSFFDDPDKKDATTK